jgi:hypothetical protein
MRKYCDAKKCDLEILMDLHIFRLIGYENVVLACHLYVCMDVCPLVPEQLDGFYSYSVVKSLSIIGQCPVNMNIPAPKIGTLEKRPKIKWL